jgi:undecaprenyl-diphosphatase
LDWWQAILLGALQGVTEFLPVSSSGHLVLAQHFLGFPDESEASGAALFFDGCLHLGTLVAVLLYLRSDLQRQLGGQASAPADWRSLARLGMLVALASLPAAVAVVLASDHIKESFAEPIPVAFALVALGVILLVTNQLPRGSTSAPRTAWWQALLIGTAQACSAVVRGLSRSGMTIAAGLAVGLERDWAVRFSFLMSIVANLGLGGLGIWKALQETGSQHWLTREFMLLTLAGTVTSGLVGYLTIRPLILLVRRSRLWWFAVYLWLVGGTVLLHHFLSAA